MDELSGILDLYANGPVFVLDNKIPIQEYVPIDLSVANEELENIDIGDSDACQHYIDSVLNENSGSVAYGGYLEKRSLYRNKFNFSVEGLRRNIHLGMDFWTKAGTAVLTPLNGMIHSFKNNDIYGDYGPTIILQHELNNLIFHTLYGHLSLESLNGLYIGREFKKGQKLATLGTPGINVGYAPHLHFQIIHDMQDCVGDYPGVCTVQDLDFYSKNCPDPNLLLKLNP